MGRGADRMRLYDDAIQGYVDRFHGLYAHPTPEQYERAKHMLWSYHEDRFLDTLKGYHEVTTLRYRRFDNGADGASRSMCRATAT